MAEYTKEDVARRTGISPTKVHYFVDKDVTIPAERQRGRAVVYTERNLLEIMMAIVMQEQNMSLNLISGAFSALRAIETGNNSSKEPVTDFFTNDEWGRKKDIMVAGAWVDDYPRVAGEPGVWRYQGDIVKMDYKVTDELQKLVIAIANGPVVITPLGKIKNQAISKLKP